MSEQNNNSIRVNMTGGEIDFDQNFMNVMWEESRLQPFPVDGLFSFEVKDERFGITDLLCFLEDVNEDLREKGPEAIIEALLELINSVYIGDETIALIGRVTDIYAVELSNRAGLVFRTVIVDSQRSIEEMLEIREVAKTLFPVPEPQSE